MQYEAGFPAVSIAPSVRRQLPLTLRDASDVHCDSTLGKAGSSRSLSDSAVLVTPSNF